MKTFYSVKYIAPGMLRTSTKWFRSRQDAENFISNADIRADSIKTHNFRKDYSIREIEDIIQGQERPYLQKKIDKSPV